MTWETVIGLEVHVQLNTKSKIFSGSSTQYGQAPNTQASAVDLALPGTLPVPNKAAFEKAIMFGLAIDAEINQRSVFERKNYFYPDLPKGYQTTQLEKPIVGAGKLELDLADGSTKTVRIHHAHLEEDAGKSVHENFSQMSGIDLNRAGTPLIEVVTEPDMRNAEEAVAFAKKLHNTVVSLGICDGEMSQGSMRFDVNISVRRSAADELGTRTETKNLNSFRFMESCIEQEVARQIDVLESGGTIAQETRLYDGDTHTAKSMRSKEEANDYRYFPCPDLLPVVISDELIEQLRAKLPEMPDKREARFIKEYKLSEYDAGLLSADKQQADFFEGVVALCKDPKLAANWMTGEVAAALNQQECSIAELNLSAMQLGVLISRIKDGTLSNKTAKVVFSALLNGDTADVDRIIAEKGLKQVNDSSAIEAFIDEVIQNNPKQVENFQKAAADKQPKMLGFFVGQVMKLSKGQANPQQVNELLLKKLSQ